MTNQPIDDEEALKRVLDSAEEYQTWKAVRPVMDSKRRKFSEIQIATENLAAAHREVGDPATAERLEEYANRLKKAETRHPKQNKKGRPKIDEDLVMLVADLGDIYVCRNGHRFRVSVKGSFSTVDYVRLILSYVEPEQKFSDDQISYLIRKAKVELEIRKSTPVIDLEKIDLMKAVFY